MAWTRRDALRLGGSIVPLSVAGCSEILGRSGAEVRSAGESSSHDGTTVTVAETAVQGSFLRRIHGLWTPVPLGLDRYVFAYVAVSGRSPPAPDEFRFVRKRVDDGEVFNHETVRGTDDLNVSPTQRIHDREQWYSPGDGLWSGWVAFVDEIAKPDEAYIEWKDARWELPRTALERFDGFPAFEYSSIDVPDQVSPEEMLEIRVKLRNVNDSYAGVCRGALHLLQPRPNTVPPAETAELFQVPIEPGQTTTWTTTFESEFLQSVSNLRFLLKSHAGERELTVDVTT